MKNTRRAIISPEFISKNKLSSAPPPPDSLFWTMWNAWYSVAQEALATDFVQGIKNGNLDPTVYGGFNVNDAFYCFHGAKDYKDAAEHATEPTLKAFLLKKYESYEKYNATFPSTWHVRDGHSIVPFSVTREYSDFERGVARDQDAIYSIVCMLPCEYLWAWLGAQLAPPASGNLYASWITGNDDPSGAYTMGNYLDFFQKAYPGKLDPALATEIYGKAMNYEFNNFKISTTSN